MARPAIGICAAVERAQWSVWDQQAMLIPRNYVDAVSAAGGMPLLVLPDPQLLREPGELLDRLDGVILAGGADIDPSFYGAEPGPATVGCVPERDAFEIGLTRAAIARDMPLLGICRGLQLLNVACGGTLIQDLPPEHGHRRSLGSFAGAGHYVRLEPDSLAARAAGEQRHHVLSHHHQGIDRLGRGLRVSGRAEEDGLAETVELPGARFVLGVQWHPEADVESRVIAALVGAAS
ncbi:MAG: gamma-glutamyl-gamma-aminobutyrate hydrolase [Solirubrobacteraceae bacterium]